MNAISEVGPVAISVDASSWGAYESGIYNGCNQENPDIDHAVVLVGYGVDNGQKYWTVRNSWSPAWGEKGYIRFVMSWRALCLHFFAIYMLFILIIYVLCYNILIY